jgi:hypothetical protein
LYKKEKDLYKSKLNEAIYPTGEGSIALPGSSELQHLSSDLKILLRLY